MYFRPLIGVKELPFLAGSGVNVNDEWPQPIRQPLGLSTDRYFGTQIADTVICFILCHDFVL